MRLGAVAALAVAAGLVAWLLLREGGGGSTHMRAVSAHAASPTELAALPSTVHHPVYWAGPQSGTTYEVRITSSGLVYLRYLPAGVPVGAKPGYLTIGTYPVKDALAAVRGLAKRVHATPLPLSGGGLAVQSTTHPSSVYFAAPGSDYQVEVFSPSPAQARSLVLSGQVVPIGTQPRSAKAPAKAATVADLHALAKSAGHAVYWAGPEAGTTYEQTETSDGRIYIRYLRGGASVGSAQPFLTIGTYPVQDAAAAVRGIAKRTGGRTFTTRGGGVAVVDPVHPTSVYLAFPGSNYEIEVFDPVAARARRLVASGGVVPVR